MTGRPHRPRPANSRGTHPRQADCRRPGQTGTDEVEDRRSTGRTDQARREAGLPVGSTAGEPTEERRDTLEQIDPNRCPAWPVARQRRCKLRRGLAGSVGQRRRHPPAHPHRPSPRITKAWAGSGYRTKVIDHGATLGIDVEVEVEVEVVKRGPDARGFKVIPRRWVVERTFGWLMHHRRLARGYETHPTTPKP
jgi:transposase